LYNFFCFSGSSTYSWVKSIFLLVIIILFSNSTDFGIRSNLGHFFQNDVHSSPCFLKSPLLLRTSDNKGHGNKLRHQDQMEGTKVYLPIPQPEWKWRPVYVHFHILPRVLHRAAILLLLTCGR